MAKKKNEDALLEQMNRLNLSKDKDEADGEVERLDDEEKEARVASVVDHFDTTYESISDKLEAWQLLCRDFGVPEGTTIKQCKKAMRRVKVNIFDYVEDKKANSPLRRYQSEKDLRAYSKKTNRIFPLNEAKQETVLRALLIKMFFRFV